MYTVQAATDLRNRIRWHSFFYKLEKVVTGMPLSFTDTRLNFTQVGGIFDLSELLKDWFFVDSKSDYSNQRLARCAEKPVTIPNKRIQLSEGGDASSDNTVVLTSSAEFLLALHRLNQAVTEDNLASLERIKKLADPSLPKKKRLSKDQILVGIGVHLVKKLQGVAQTTLKRSQMACPCGCKEKLDYSPEMYIGSENTWHGELDIKSYGVGITTSSGIETSNAAEPDDETSEEQDSTSTVQDETDETRPVQQVIAQSIVFGWTQYNRHPDKGADIPLIYIDSKKYGVFIYNPEADSLLISEWPLLFCSDRPMKTLSDKYSGIFILWLFMNHRIFFKKQITSRWDCEFKTLMAQDMEFYKQLKSYSNSIKIHTQGLQWNQGGIGILDHVEQPDKGSVKGIKRKFPE